MKFSVEGRGLMVLCVRVSGFGFRVSGFGLRITGYGFRVSGFGFAGWGWGLGLRVRVESGLSLCPSPFVDLVRFAEFHV